MAGNNDKNVAFAFGLSIAAGLSTSFGALLPFIINIKDSRYLGMSLSFSAGVMLYISFADILLASREAFISAYSKPGGSFLYDNYSFEGVNASSCESIVNDVIDTCNSVNNGNGGNGGGFSHKAATLAATGCFFLGMFIIVVLDFLLHKVNGDTDEEEDFTVLLQTLDSSNRYSNDISMQEFGNIKDSGDDIDPNVVDENNNTLSANKRITESHFDGNGIEDIEAIPRTTTSESESDRNIENDRLLSRKNQLEAQRSRKLNKMGLVTAVAIAIHNFPEGLSTFVASMKNQGLGFTLAIAIALHNIPEGICVGMPVYFATGSKWKAFWWATLAGFAEPVGALIGYLVLYDNYSDLAFGIMFAIVAGIMVQICIQELLPQAFRHDIHNTYVTKCIMAGFGVMALSLLLFV